MRIRTARIGLEAAAGLALLLAGCRHSPHKASAADDKGAASPAPAMVLRILTLSGPIQIQGSDGSLTGVVPGGVLPDIPGGSQVTMLSGMAGFSLGEAKINVRAPTTFSLSALPGSDRAVQLSASGQKSRVKVIVGEARIFFATGSSISLSGPQMGSMTVAVLRGKAAFSMPGTPAKALTAGQSVSIPSPGAAPQSAPRPAGKKPSAQTPAR